MIAAASLVIATAPIGSLPAKAQLSDRTGAGSSRTIDNANRQRTLRSIEGRAVTDPQGAARDARRALRSPGLTGGPDGQGIDAGVPRDRRTLERVRDRPRPGSQLPSSQGLRPPDRVTLPSSVEPGLLPSDRDPLDSVGSLLDSAEFSLVTGDARRARADLDFARRRLRAITTDLGSSAETNAAQSRLSALEQRLP